MKIVVAICGLQTKFAKGIQIIGSMWIPIQHTFTWVKPNLCMRNYFRGSAEQVSREQQNV
jgi:hypothetical protein